MEKRLAAAMHLSWYRDMKVGIEVAGSCNTHESFRLRKRATCNRQRIVAGRTQTGERTRAGSKAHLHIWRKTFFQSCEPRQQLLAFLNQQGADGRISAQELDVLGLLP